MQERQRKHENKQVLSCDDETIDGAPARWTRLCVCSISPGQATIAHKICAPCYKKVSWLIRSNTYQ